MSELQQFPPQFQPQPQPEFPPIVAVKYTNGVWRVVAALERSNPPARFWTSPSAGFLFLQVDPATALQCAKSAGYSCSPRRLLNI